MKILLLLSGFLLLTLLAISFILWPLWRKQQSHKSLIIITILLLALAIGIAWHSQQIATLWHRWQHQKAQAQAKILLKNMHNPSQIINPLQHHLTKNPNDPQGWYLLGRLYLGQNKALDAQTAFAHAHQLAPTEPQYLLALAQADILNSQALSSSVRTAVQHLLHQQPHNRVALNLLALDAYHRHCYAMAARYWEKLIPLFAAGSQGRQAVLKMIRMAEQHQKHQGSKT